MTTMRLLRGMLKAIGVVDIGNDPDPAEYEDALESVNSLLELWAAEGLILYHVVTSSLAMVVGQASYTIGSGGDFNIGRPNKIVGGYTRDSASIDAVMQTIDRDQYNRQTNKSASGRPSKMYYYPAYPLGTLYFDCKPDKAYTLFLDALLPLTALTLGGDVDMPPEYKEALKWNGAQRLAPDYSVPVSDIVARLARDTYNALTVQPVPMATFADGVPGTRRPGWNYNINAG